MRPGREITVVNMTARGVLVRTPARVLPGKRVDLHLRGTGGRWSVGGRVVRCRIVALSPLCYEAAIELDERAAIVPDDEQREARD